MNECHLRTKDESLNPEFKKRLVPVSTNPTPHPHMYNNPWFRTPQADDDDRINAAE